MPKSRASKSSDDEVKNSCKIKIPKKIEKNKVAIWMGHS